MEDINATNRLVLKSSLNSVLAKISDSIRQTKYRCVSRYNKCESFFCPRISLSTMGLITQRLLNLLLAMNRQELRYWIEVPLHLTRLSSIVSYDGNQPLNQKLATWHVASEQVSRPPFKDTKMDNHHNHPKYCDRSLIVPFQLTDSVLWW